MNTRKRPAKCKECGRAGTRTRPISTRGLCYECGPARAIEAATQMANKQGDYYQRWYENSAKALALNAPPRVVEAPFDQDDEAQTG